MDDIKIVELFWARSESAISEAKKKYQKQLHSLAFGILRSFEDSEECENDAYLRAWNSIPPKRPEYLGGFLHKIVRNLALNKRSQYSAQKRGGGQVELALTELEDCIPSVISVESEIEDGLIADSINTFLKSLKSKDRVIFVRRYFYLLSIAEIAKGTGLSESGVKSALFRMRNKLKDKLQEEGIFI